MMMPSKCKSFLLKFAGTVAAAGLAGCSGYFPFAKELVIEQGNLLDREDIEQLEVGMTERQVQRLLGNPVLEHPFEEQRWDYLYRRHGGQEEERKRLTLYFEDGRVAEIEDHWREG